MGFILALALIAVIVLVVIVVVAVVRGRKSTRRRPSHTGSTGYIDCTNMGGPMIEKGLLGTSVPIKAVYVGYAAGVSDIVTTVQAAASAGYNLIILAFYMGPSIGADPYSALWYWQQLSQSAREGAITFVHNAGARLMLSAGGAGYNAYPANGASDFGNGAANFALSMGLDGVDFDLENFNNSFGTPSGLNKAQTIAWITTANQAARTLLGTNRVITHAPQGPYFSGPEFEAGYTVFMLQTPPPSVDLLLIQMYNQGTDAYQTYATQFLVNILHPGTAIAELISAGLNPTKLVIGKLTQATDGEADSWVDPTTLGQWFAQAATDPSTSDWKTGLSTWQWHQNGDGTPSSAAFLSAVYP